MYKCSPMVPNIPFWTIMSLFKSEDTISCYTPSHLNSYKPHINFLILTINSPCKYLVKISAF